MKGDASRGGTNSNLGSSISYITQRKASLLLFSQYIRVFCRDVRFFIHETEILPFIKQKKEDVCMYTYKRGKEKLQFY